MLAQRLVRLVCEHCKQAVEPSAELLAASGLEAVDVSEATFYEGVGCAVCHGTAYRGRTVIAELLDMNDTTRELILARRPI